jgi:hypothetical protein
MPSQEAPTDRTFLQGGWFIPFCDMDAPEHPTNNKWGTWLKFFGIQYAICLGLWVRVSRNDGLPSGAFPRVYPMLKIQPRVHFGDSIGFVLS